jgi:hypothetical protein
VWVATSIRAARGASCGLENRQTDMGGNKLGEVEVHRDLAREMRVKSRGSGAVRATT